MLDLIVYIIAGLGAGIVTGLAGLSAAAVISPILITVLNFEPFVAIGISLSSDVLASALSAATYAKNKHIDVKGGLWLLLPAMVQNDFPMSMWILAGGVVYSVGIIPFVIKVKVSHFIWHFFVLAGAVVQWIGIFTYLYVF